MVIKARNKIYIIYSFFLILNILLFTYNIINKTQWALDILFSTLIITGILLASKKLEITPLGFLLINLGFLLHNLGSFGFYSKTFGSFEYDNIVHLFASITAAYVVFNLIGHKLHIKKNKRIKKTVIDYNKILLILLVIASVSMLGTLVELIEFSGFLYLWEGEGLFFIGIGDSNHGGDTIEGQYVDTMNDIFVNTIGSIIGIILFYKFRYKKNYWLN
ncbi:MAG: hypothetical protein KKA79_09140 [Nanoarchaeota archaeon]|nr:hypothetical protein [Nanoarchaeota archaeon]MCG2718113.1 hypothetical protein [Nanoarchaeota archaeon]